MAECSLANSGSEMCHRHQDNEHFIVDTPDEHFSLQDLPSTSLGLRGEYNRNHLHYFHSEMLMENNLKSHIIKSTNLKPSKEQNCPISSRIANADQDSESDDGRDINSPPENLTDEYSSNVRGKRPCLTSKMTHMRRLNKYLDQDEREISMATLNGWGKLMTDIRRKKKRERTLRRASNVKKRRKRSTKIIEQEVERNVTIDSNIPEHRRRNGSLEAIATHADSRRWEKLQWLLIQDDVEMDERVANKWMPLMTDIRKGSSIIQRNLKAILSDPVVESDDEPDIPDLDLIDYDNEDALDFRTIDFLNLDWPDDELGILTGRAGAHVSEETYPKGEVVERECYICYEVKEVTLRVCCGIPLCDSCMDMYLKTQVQDAIVKIECLNMECDSYVHRDEVFARLPVELKSKYYKFLVDANKDPHMKTCPQCNHVRKVRKEELTVNKKIYKRGLQVTCDECQLVWCFSCHAPWHEGVTCKQYLKGDKLVKHWAKEQHFGQRNAQKCPKCKVFIERIQGCDHMTCSRCSSEFCYRCGERYITDKTRILGNHHSRFSPFGCKYNLMPERPVARRCIRGAVASGKVLGTILVAGLAVAGGAALLSIGVIALPIYCCHKGLKKRKRNRARLRRELWTTPRMVLEDVEMADIVDVSVGNRQFMDQTTGTTQNSDSSDPPSWSDWDTSSGGYGDSDFERSISDSDSASSVWMGATKDDEKTTSIMVGDVDITVKGSNPKSVSTSVESQEKKTETEYPEIILKVKSSYKDSEVVEQSDYMVNHKVMNYDQKSERVHSAKSDMHVSSIGENVDGSGNECGYRLNFDKKFKVMLNNLHAKVKENHSQITSLQNRIAVATEQPNLGDSNSEAICEPNIVDSYIDASFSSIDKAICETNIVDSYIDASFSFIDEDSNPEKASDGEQSEDPSESFCSDDSRRKTNSTADLSPNFQNSVHSGRVHVSEIDDKCSPGCFVNILKSESSKRKYIESSSSDLESQDVTHDTCAVQGCFVNLFSKRLSLQSKEGDKLHVKKELAKHLYDGKSSDNNILTSDPEDHKDMGIVCSEKHLYGSDHQTETTCISGVLSNTSTETYL